MATWTPQAWIEGCQAAHRRLDALLDAVTDDVARRPSRCEGWSVGHVLTHLARNADGMRNVVEGAQRGEIAMMYPGGREQRNSAIEAGSGRPAAALAADVREAMGRLEAAWASTSPAVWSTALGALTGGVSPLSDYVRRRWCETEVHTIDLGLVDRGGPDWDGLSPAYVDLDWLNMAAIAADRAPAGQALLLVPGDRPPYVIGTGPEKVVVRGTPSRLLGWMMRGVGDPSWPALRPWGY